MAGLRVTAEDALAERISTGGGAFHVLILCQLGVSNRRRSRNSPVVKVKIVADVREGDGIPCSFGLILGQIDHTGSEGLRASAFMQNATLRLTDQTDMVLGLLAVVQQVLHFTRVDTRHAQHQLTRYAQRRRPLVLRQDSVCMMSAGDSFL